MNYYNRYSEFAGDNNIKTVPYISLPDSPTDKVKIFDRATDRLDNLSFEYYGSPHFDWLIRMKNAKLGADEFEWEDNSPIIIPYPLRDSVQAYASSIQLMDQRYFTKR
jgi:hypothetical protein